MRPIDLSIVRSRRWALLTSLHWFPLEKDALVQELFTEVCTNTVFAMKTKGYKLDKNEPSRFLHSVVYRGILWWKQIFDILLNCDSGKYFNAYFENS